MSVTGAFIPMHPSHPRAFCARLPGKEGALEVLATEPMLSLLFHNLSVPKAKSFVLIRFTRIGMKMTSLCTYLLCIGEREHGWGFLIYKKEKWVNIRPEESWLV